jgi:hypothetical protein
MNATPLTPALETTPLTLVRWISQGAVMQGVELLSVEAGADDPWETRKHSGEPYQ